MLFRYRDLPISVKMPDSPDAGRKCQVPPPASNGMPVSLSTHKVNSQHAMNGSHSPHPPGTGRTPSPPTNTLPTGLQGALGSPGTQHSGDLSSGQNGATKGRHVAKVKRFLSTLQQFASEISVEVGERVHGLILGLVTSSVSIEDFHQKIQEITNYPLRPFAIPFLKSHLPLLQTELLHFSRLAKQSPQQYLRHNEHLLLQADHAPQHAEPFDIFQAEAKENGKRRSPSSRSNKVDQDYCETNGDYPPPAKRHQSLPSPTLGPRVSPASSQLPPGLNFRFDDPLHVYRERENRYDRYDRFEREFYRPFYGSIPRDFSEDRDMEEEWRNIHTMLNCILGMVEKTKRALAILQHRSYTERTELSGWMRAGRPGLAEPEHEHKKPSGRPTDIVSHYKVAEERVSEVRRRAEDAVNEVKRQAVAELQKAVSAAECKAGELVAAERAKMERLLTEARRQASEDTLAALTQQEESTENCWNCGRKANETCSGCNVARYCGSFCQHKDWETHHRICGQTSTSLPGTSTSSPPSRSAINKSPSPIRTSNLVDIKPIKIDCV